MPSHFLPPRIAARWFTGKHPESHWPSIARDALEAGLDGPALRRLASYEQKLHWDVAKYSEPALSEMDASKMSQGKHFFGLPKMSVVTFSKALETHSKSDRLRRRCFPEELMPIFNEIEMHNTGLLPGSDQ